MNYSVRLTGQLFRLLRLSILPTALIPLSPPSLAASNTDSPPLSSWVYASTDVQQLRFQQNSRFQSSLLFTALAPLSLAVQAGTSRDGWGIEAGCKLYSYDLNATAEGTAYTFHQSGLTADVTVLRRLFTNFGPFRLNGQARLGYTHSTFPALELMQAVPELRRGQVSFLRVGLGMSSYARKNLRLGLSLLWLPMLHASSNFNGEASFHENYNWEVGSGVQYLLTRHWNLGTWLSFASSAFNYKQTGPTGLQDQGDISFRQSSIQFRLGYQF